MSGSGSGSDSANKAVPHGDSRQEPAAEPPGGLAPEAPHDESRPPEASPGAPIDAPDPKAAAATKRTAVSVGLAAGTYGISFGALSVASGLSVWQTCALSLLMFTGGSQFALVGVLGAGGTGLSAVATASLLGVRNGLYGLQVVRLLDVHGLRRTAAAQLTIDESTAVAVAQPTTALARVGFWWTGLAVFVFWNLTTLVGALLGNALGDPKTYGLDAAAAAAFCALLWPRLRSARPVAVAAAAIALALVVAPHVPAGVPVLVAAIAALLGGAYPAARTGRHRA